METLGNIEVQVVLERRCMYSTHTMATLKRKCMTSYELSVRFLTNR